MARTSDERILAALISCGSIRAAAERLGVSQKRISERLKDPDFRERYEAKKNELLQSTVSEMVIMLTTAVNTLAAVMNDSAAAGSVRVQAADAMLRHGLRYLEAADFERRLRELEESQRK